jgi:multidrug resistance protein
MPGTRKSELTASRNGVKSHSALLLIFLTVFIDLLGFGILIPILPTFATKDLNMNETAIGIVLAVYSLFQFIFNPILGRLSDRNGRKPIITFCLLLNAAGYIIFAYTSSFSMLLVSRIIGGIGGSSVSTAQAYIADITTKENRSKGMGLIGMAFGLGFVFGPFLGGLLSKYSYAVVGYGSAFFSLTAFLFTIIFLPESNKQKNKEIKIKFKLVDVQGIKRVFSKHLLGSLVIIFFILTFSMANTYGTVPLLGYEVYHFSDLQNGYIFGIIGVVGAIVQGGLLRVITKFLNDTKIIMFGAISMVAGFALMPYGETFLGLVLVASLLAFGIGILQPTVLSLISGNTDETEQGMTLGINQSFSAFGRVLGPLWGGFAFQYLGYQYPFLTGALFSLIIVVICALSLQKKLKVTEQEAYN